MALREVIDSDGNPTGSFVEVCDDNAKTVSILGTKYTITVKKYDEDKQFTDEGAGAYCTGVTHEIVCCDLTSHPDFKLETEAAIDQTQKRYLRHEIVHAFLEESGLSENSKASYGSWARNEEMVDWIAIQGPKIYKAWQEAGCL